MKKRHKRMNMGGMTNEPRPIPAGPQPDPNPARPTPPIPMGPAQTAVPAQQKMAQNTRGNLGLGLAGLRENIMSRIGNARKMAEQRRAALAVRRSATGTAKPTMKGGGLARKGVGQALKAGGAVKACGVAKRGKTKGKMV